MLGHLGQPLPTTITDYPARGALLRGNLVVGLVLVEVAADSGSPQAPQTERFLADAMLDEGLFGLLAILCG